MGWSRRSGYQLAKRQESDQTWQRSRILNKAKLELLLSDFTESEETNARLEMVVLSFIKLQRRPVPGRDT